MRKNFILIFLLGIIPCFAIAQDLPPAPLYRILIKGGHVIDPKNKIDEPMDIAIRDGKIAKVAKNINASLSAQLIDATGLYVTPGLIDIHAHLFYGTELNNSLSNSSDAVMPDGFTFRSGVTTVIDAGGAGWKSFDKFKKNVIDQSRTRVLLFLNIIGEGMRGGHWEQDISDMNPRMSAKTALENKNYIVGFKLAHFQKPDWTSVQTVLEAGKIAQLPVMVDFGEGRLSLDTLFNTYLRPGDIYTHTFTQLDIREPIVDPKTGKLKPFMIPAQNKGIIFDVGFGGGSFNFNQVIPALKAGFLPNTMGTDLHTGSMNGAMKNQLNVLSTFLALGMDLPSVILRSTWAPAQVIKHEELGHLSVGAIADVAILNVRKGKFGFLDVARNKQAGSQRLGCEVTIKDGRVVYDMNARVVSSSEVGSRP